MSNRSWTVAMLKHGLSFLESNCTFRLKLCIIISPSDSLPIIPRAVKHFPHVSVRPSPSDFTPHPLSAFNQFWYYSPASVSSFSVSGCVYFNCSLILSCCNHLHYICLRKQTFSCNNSWTIMCYMYSYPDLIVIQQGLFTLAHMQLCAHQTCRSGYSLCKCANEVKALQRGSLMNIQICLLSLLLEAVGCACVSSDHMAPDTLALCF